MGDCLLQDKLPVYDTIHPGQLSLLPSAGQEISTGQNMMMLCAWGMKADVAHSTHTHTHPYNGPLSRTTRVSRYQKGKNQSGFYWSERHWVAVESAGPYASLHLAPDRYHASTPPLIFLQAGCPSCCPTNSVKALKALKVWLLPLVNKCEGGR